jgi:lipopolysaccharide/colanic/teichoic acid biosynthesis glycosyltransferase
MKSHALLSRAGNRCFGAIFLFLSAPLMACIALAIRLESAGPIFSRQKQQSFGHHKIEVLKFRTTYQTPPKSERAQQIERSDRLLTRVGWFLRSSSLDELPLLLNMLRGEMCIFGRRLYAGTLYMDASLTANHVQ